MKQYAERGGKTEYKLGLAGANQYFQSMVLNSPSSFIGIHICTYVHMHIPKK